MSTKKFPVLLLQSRKMKGYNLQQNCCTSSSRSHSLSHTITEIVYNTIQYHTQSCYNAFFYRGKNTMGKYYGQPNTMGLQKCWPTNIPTPKQGEGVYSTPRVQTRLNNISGSGRSSSTTKNLPLGD